MSGPPPVDAAPATADKPAMSTTAIAAAIIIPFCLGMLMLWSIFHYRDRSED